MTRPMPALVSAALCLLTSRLTAAASALPVFRHAEPDAGLAGSIVFSTVGRVQYAFDVYGAPLAPNSSSGGGGWGLGEERRLTDGVSVNFNGHFTHDGEGLLFVSERAGNMELYHAALGGGGGDQQPLTRITHALSMQDRPLTHHATGHLFFVSTHEPSSTPRQAWSAIYSLDDQGRVRRLTPQTETDMSPALSADGALLAAATGGGKTGQADVVLMQADTGEERRILAKNGGWPAFVGTGSSARVVFHRKGADGWWSLYSVDLEGRNEERLTGPGTDVFTPAAAPGRGWLVAATRAPGGHRQIARIAQDSQGKWTQQPLTSGPRHHYNPFLSADGQRLGYHRCSPHGTVPTLELRSSPSEGLAVARVDGAFPSFPPNASFMAYSEGGFAALSLVPLDGSPRRQLLREGTFGTSSGRYQGRDIIVTARGPVFASLSTEVHIVRVEVPPGGGAGEGREAAAVQLTAEGTTNNAFPSLSPDGSEVVFRSSRSGAKNLWVMSIEGESRGLRRLTHGPWDDTMPKWSPDGRRIIFASDRDKHTAANMTGFDIFTIRPDGSDLRKVFQGYGGLANHPEFSPDQRHIVFTSDHGGYSAEMISVPHQFQPYGDIYVQDADGANLRRITHDAYENGTPGWGAAKLTAATMPGPTGNRVTCDFDDSEERAATGLGVEGQEAAGAWCSARGERAVQPVREAAAS